MTRNHPEPMVSNRRGFLRHGALALAGLAAGTSRTEQIIVDRLLSAVLPSRYAVSRAFVLRGATLVDVRSERLVPDSELVIEADRIVRVGRSDGREPPADAQLVDVRGKWIMPGLIDMHVHGSTRPDVPLELYVANGVTGIRDLGGDLTTLRLLRQELESGKRLGPRLFFAGPILDGNPPAAPSVAIVVDTPRRATSAVEFLIDQGVDTIKVYNGLSGTALDAAARAAHQRNVPVVGHVPKALTVEQAVSLGLDGIEHSAIRAADLVAWRMLDAAEARRIASLAAVTEREALVWKHVEPGSPRVGSMIARLAESRVVLCPTLGIDEFDSRFLYPAEADHPLNRFVPQSFLEESLGPDHDIFRTPRYLEALVSSGIEKRRRFVELCARAGVPIVAGTDGPGIGRLVAGFGLHHELKLLAESGLTPMHAIRAATIDASSALRRDNELGSIEPGKLADLVVLDTDPTATIRSALRIHGVLFGGRLLNRHTLDGILARVQKQARSGR